MKGAKIIPINQESGKSITGDFLKSLIAGNELVKIKLKYGTTCVCTIKSFKSLTPDFIEIIIELEDGQRSGIWSPEILSISKEQKNGNDHQ